jgi:hypothetical protein
MNDRETTLLRPRLERLADEMAPASDPVRHAVAARARYRRQRRVRTAVTAAAAAAVLLGVGVPVTLSSLSSSPPGEVAGPSEPPSEPPTERDRDQSVIEDEVADQRREQDDLDRRSQEAVELQGAFTGRPAPVSLAAPADPDGCPELTDDFLVRLKADVEFSGGALSDGLPGCRWSTAAGPEHGLTVGIAWQAGVTEEQVRTEVNQDRVNLGCFPAAMPQAPPTPVLSICPGEGLEVWSLNLPLADGSGTWVLSMAMGDDFVGVGRPAAMGALLDLADATW